MKIKTHNLLIAFLLLALSLQGAACSGGDDAEFLDGSFDGLSSESPSSDLQGAWTLSTTVTTVDDTAACAPFNADNLAYSGIDIVVDETGCTFSDDSFEFDTEARCEADENSIVVTTTYSESASGCTFTQEQILDVTMTSGDTFAGTVVGQAGFTGSCGAAATGACDYNGSVTVEADE